MLYDLGETDGIFRREEEGKGASGDLGRDNIIERDIGDIGDKGLDILFETKQIQKIKKKVESPKTTFLSFEQRARKKERKKERERERN
ncbi:MAG: hypothetical protein Q8P67_00805 [archaeon]|nr:hypothetical protein [archaeon]